MTTSAAHADAFYSEVLAERVLWTVRDVDGFPAPVNGDGARAMPFWSKRSRAERVVASAAAYAGFELVEIALHTWREDWLTGLDRDGVLVGLNWAGERAQGYDVASADVLRSLAAREPGSDERSGG